MKNKLSPTYYNIVDMLFKAGRQSIVTALHSDEFSEGQYKMTNTGLKTHRLFEPIYIANTELWKTCTPAEWNLIGRITNELKECCVLWECSKELKKNGNIVKAIRGLITKDILIKTESTDIYVVNPTHVRRGNPFTVLSTTADTLKEATKVTSEHIRNRKPIKEFRGYESSTPILLGN